MSTSKVEIQDGSGNVYYPKTSIDSVIYSDNTSIEEKIRMLETKLNELKSRLVDSINDKTGSSLTSNSTVDEMAAIINSIKTLEQATADANATASNILVDKTAYVNGVKITGIMPNKGAVTASLNCGGSYTIPEGYHNGSGKVTANSLASQMSNAGVTVTNPSQVISGYKVLDKSGNLITGTATIQSLGGSSFISGTGSITLTEHQPHIWVDFSEKVPSNVRVIWGKFSYHINEYLFVNFRSEASGTFIPIVWNRHFSSYYKQSPVDITKICLGEGDSCHNWPAETYTYTWYAL